ncbi:MAG: quinone-dependent dihydroorotate dehydrogenase [Microbacteriaceae bacterium]
MYSLLFNTVISRLDAEFAHKLAGLVLRVLPRTKISTEPRGGSVETLGLTFQNRLGMAAGFDKDGRYLAALSRRGFGHIEIGTVTAEAQAGNPQPRLFRLVEERAIINRMGFNNRGAAALASRLKKFRPKHPNIIIGANIGKTKNVEIEHAIADYLTSTDLLAGLCDYLVVNVSSPNTPGLRGLQELDHLEPLLKAIRERAGKTPLLVKIAPDLPDEQVEKIAELAVSLGLNGIIATNTTISREDIPLGRKNRDEAGGLSGPQLSKRSVEILRILRSHVPEEFCLISVGGISNQADFEERIAHGATLVQGYTGFIYQGPQWPKQILQP